MNKMQYKTENQKGFGRRIHILTEPFVFNYYTLKRGLTTDGGSVPKIFIIGLFLVLNFIYDFHLLTNIIIFAIAIDESNGWFQKPFFAHDQRWSEATSWKHFFSANWAFYQDMLYQVSDYQNEYWLKYFFHVPLGYLLAIIYPLSVTIFGWYVFYFKHAKDFNKRKM